MQKSCYEAEINSRFTNIFFSNQEQGIFHNPYDQEQRELSSITNGDINQLEMSINEQYQGQIGRLSHNNLRNSKNLAIVLCTLASRAAIKGGLNPEIAFSLSDCYIQKIEELNDGEEVLNLARSAEYQYARMVHEVRSVSSSDVNSNPKIAQCCTFISVHLTEKITLNDIASYAGTSPNYLSELFSKYMHVTISEYILQERLKLAKQLLIYSNYSIGDISQYLNFNSQSYFGDKFKKLNGMTPLEFRNRYRRTSND